MRITAVDVSMTANLLLYSIFHFWPYKQIWWLHSLFHYCKGLIECPRTLLPFIIIQHAHFCSKQTLACSCLHIEQMHPCLLIMLTLFCCFDFSSAYNHSTTRGTPIAKNMSIVRRGTRRTNNASPKHRAAIPKIDIQRVVGSMNTLTGY